MPSIKKKGEGGGVGQVFHNLLKEIGNQVEFELPDWVDKQKPLPYVLIKRNIYVTKKFKRRLEDDGIFCTCNSSTGASVCGRDCHCGMLYSTCSSGCKCESSCLNKPFQHRPPKKMKLVKTEKCGSGIIADEDIKQKEFIIEYVGEVIDDKTCEERLWKMKHIGETNFYLCEINRDMVIDATFKGNQSRYINHSCCPNTEMQKWIIDGETRIGIFAARDIKKGEHLTYDYQFVQFGADQDCHCGAVKCRRKLGVKPNKPKVYSNGVPQIGNSRYAPSQKSYHCNCIGEVIRITCPVGGRSFGIIKRFDNTTRQHLLMFEDGTNKVLDLSKEDWEFCTS